MSQNAASWSDVRRIILHESFASTVPASIFTTAAANNYLDVKISKTLHADFVLPECQPTCAFILIHTDTLHTDGIAHYIPRLEKLQSSFRNTYCVLLTHNTDIENETWVDLNLTCPVGRLRLLMVHSLKEFEDVVLGIFQTMTQTEKFQIQRDFFEQEKANNLSSGHARVVAMDALERIGLQESEARLVMQATSSIKNLILLAASSTIEELEESIPVDREALEAIKTFVKDPLSLPSVNK